MIELTNFARPQAAISAPLLREIAVSCTGESGQLAGNQIKTLTLQAIPVKKPVRRLTPTIAFSIETLLKTMGPLARYEIHRELSDIKPASINSEIATLLKSKVLYSSDIVWSNETAYEVKRVFLSAMKDKERSYANTRCHCPSAIESW